ncbi:TIGR01440 family protein [Halobacillus rhizosphaerae]|uniref:TIGR01440 family protein n=1 Tax=Halobacillus rhizosphaerae TaxID=3064889 RepID=UPI00398A821C
MERIQVDVEAVVDQLIQSDAIHNGLFVVGCSTSEIAGKRIGTSGNEQIAEVIYQAMQKLAAKTNVELAFQCCEHLNRSLLVERSVQEKLGLAEVAAIPVPTAGGSMASYAYKQFKDPVLVETIHASAGIDIGDTFIGMHLKRVAVPLRIDQKSIGKAHVTSAKTRPPLIGGVRAVYEISHVVEEGSCDE